MIGNVHKMATPTHLCTSSATSTWRQSVCSRGEENAVTDANRIRVSRALMKRLPRARSRPSPAVRPRPSHRISSPLHAQQAGGSRNKRCGRGNERIHGCNLYRRNTRQSHRELANGATALATIEVYPKLGIPPSIQCAIGVRPTTGYAEHVQMPSARRR